MLIAKSILFYPEHIENHELSDEIILPSFYLTNLINSYNDTEALFVNIINIESKESAIVSIGKSHNYDKNIVYVPEWILDLIGCSNNTDSLIKIKKADISDIPNANKIVIRPLDPIAFEIDTLMCFERALKNLHSIKEGITIPISVPELGNDYIMFAHIEKIEPESLCRIVEGDIDVEFINEFNTTQNLETNNKIIIPSLENKDEVKDEVKEEIKEEINLEERRREIRESWIKRFQNNVK
jgi:hypothetical protein